MNILVTICARGGSKGVKNKNIRILIDKPLIAYTIKQALAWNKTTDVVVSTDSEAIAEVAKCYGAHVPFFRPADLASDESPKVGAIHHALAACEEKFNKKYDIVVDLDATSPVRTMQDLDNCLEIFTRMKPWVLFSAVPCHRNPYFNMVEVDSNGYAHLCKAPSSSVTRRQDAPKVFDMNASIYFYQPQFLKGSLQGTSFFEKSVLYEMNEESGYDVDREIDFKYLEFLIKEGLVKL